MITSAALLVWNDIIMQPLIDHKLNMGAKLLLIGHNYANALSPSTSARARITKIIIYLFI